MTWLGAWTKSPPELVARFDAAIVADDAWLDAWLSRAAAYAASVPPKDKAPAERPR